MHNQASRLRHEQTEAENILWEQVRAHRLSNIHFRRQYVIGEYIVDFCALRKKLIIELDGQSHTLSRQNDTERTKFLESRGYKVLRFWNSDVINDLEDVLRFIRLAVDSR